MRSSDKKHQINIGYYNIRGKAQVARLLCQYLRVPYVDLKFTLAQSYIFKKTHAFEWRFVDFPFLQEGDFVVTESVPMCLYIIDRYMQINVHPPLLGNSLKDQAVVLTYLWTIDTISNVITVSTIQKSPQELQKFKNQQWLLNVVPKLQKYEEAAMDRGWFLGYLTIIDFSVYELVRYMDKIFDGRMDSFPKLKSIELKFASLPIIQAYESSSHAIVEWDPAALIKEHAPSLGTPKN